MTNAELKEQGLIEFEDGQRLFFVDGKTYIIQDVPGGNTSDNYYAKCAVYLMENDEVSALMDNANEAKQALRAGLTPEQDEMLADYELACGSLEMAIIIKSYRLGELDGAALQRQLMG